MQALDPYVWYAAFAAVGAVVKHYFPTLGGLFPSKPAPTPTPAPAPDVVPSPAPSYSVPSLISWAFDVRAGKVKLTDLDKSLLPTFDTAIHEILKGQ